MERSRERDRSPPLAQTTRERTMAAKGILGRKLGMTQVWDEENRVIPVTVIQAGPCRVVQLKTPERDGYSAVQLAFGETKAQPAEQARARPPQDGRTSTPSKHLVELRVDDLSDFEVGQVVARRRVRRRRPGRRHRISKGKGFAGAMQRHNFKGQGASHGNHKKHRSPGSIGACATPAQGVQGHEDGRPEGQRAHHDAEPRGRRGRRRARPAPRARLGARARTAASSSSATR